MDTDRLVYLDDVAWSPDGSTIAAATSNNYILLWEANVVQPPRVLQRGDGIAWSPDGSKLAVMTPGQPADRITGQISIWDHVTEETIAVLDNVEGHVSAAWSQGSDQLAVATANSSETRISIFDVASQAIISTYSDDHAISSIDWSGDCLAYSRIADKTVIVMDLTSGRKATLQGHTALVTSVMWNPVANQLAIAGADGTIRIWDDE